jgi:hypothetical protein
MGILVLANDGFVVSDAGFGFGLDSALDKDDFGIVALERNFKLGVRGNCDCRAASATCSPALL